MWRVFQASSLLISAVHVLFFKAKQFNLTERVKVNVYVKLINFPCFSFSTPMLFSLERAVGDRYKQVFIVHVTCTGLQLGSTSLCRCYAQVHGHVFLEVCTIQEASSSGLCLHLSHKSKDTVSFQFCSHFEMTVHHCMVAFK